jgi:uncharacterized LabA/DUF88 family protein
MARKKKIRREDREEAPRETVCGPKPRGRTLIALDLANLYCQIKTAHTDARAVGPMGGDYTKLKSRLVPAGDECTMTCYAPISNPNEDRDSYTRTNNLHNMLRYCGYLVYQTERRNGKADVDVNLVVKSMEIFQKGDYDCFILVSADGDFEPLLISMREAGIRVVVASIAQYLSVKLKMNADEVVDLHDWALTPLGDGSERVRKNDMDESVIKAVELLNNAVYELGKVFDDRARRRLSFSSAVSAMGRLMGVYGACGMSTHKTILETLKDCLDAIGADGIDQEDLDYMATVIELLRPLAPSSGIVDDVKVRFSNRRVAPDA